eukprot:PhM_4_TR7506/c0_g1_i1/m.99742
MPGMTQRPQRQRARSPRRFYRIVSTPLHPQWRPQNATPSLPCSVRRGSYFAGPPHWPTTAAVVVIAALVIVIVRSTKAALPSVAGRRTPHCRAARPCRRTAPVATSRVAASSTQRRSSRCTQARGRRRTSSVSSGAVTLFAATPSARNRRRRGTGSSFRALCVGATATATASESAPGERSAPTSCASGASVRRALRRHRCRGRPGSPQPTHRIQKRGAAVRSSNAQAAAEDLPRRRPRPQRAALRRRRRSRRRQCPPGMPRCSRRCSSSWSSTSSAARRASSSHSDRTRPPHRWVAAAAAAARQQRVPVERQRTHRRLRRIRHRRHPRQGRRRGCPTRRCAFWRSSAWLRAVRPSTTAPSLRTTPYTASGSS